MAVLRSYESYYQSYVDRYDEGFGQMRFLVFAATLPGADPSPYVPAETARIKDLITEGTAEQCYVSADHGGAYIVVNTPDVNAAEAVMQTLPMAQAGLLEFTFVELAPADA